MSLEIPTEDQIRVTLNYRWPRFCLNQDVWGLKKVADQNPISKWKEVKFLKKNKDKLPERKEGIYLFMVKPKEPFHTGHSYILYVGETSDIKKRFLQYFDYKNSTHPSDQKKRRMVIVWEDYLYFNYYLTNYGTRAKRETEEYDLVDSIVPPINDKFRSKILNTHIKSLEF